MLAAVSAVAQDAYVVLKGSNHVVSVDDHADNTYQWSVYTVDDWSDQPDGILANSGDYTFRDGVDDKASVEVSMLKAGKYYLIVQEINAGTGNCSSRRTIAIEVVENGLQIAFESNGSSDCYDGNSNTLIPIKIQQNATDALLEKYYDVTVYYTVKLGASVVKTGDQTIQFIDVDENGVVDLSILGIEEELDKTKVYTITINKATDRYNTPFKIVPEQGTHTRTIHQLPQPGELVQY